MEMTINEAEKIAHAAAAPAKKPITVTIEPDNYLTVDEIGARFADMYGWKKWEFHADTQMWVFSTEYGEVRTMDLVGYIYGNDDSGKSVDSVNLEVDLDVNFLFWARDTDGNTVAIIQ